MKIKTLTLTDFRAFPGPAPQAFNLDGKNLLVYGENGAGKSSVFHALKSFFSHKPLKPLADFRNVFSKIADDAVRVAVDFDDSVAAAEWKITTGAFSNAFQSSAFQTTQEHHPIHTGGMTDQRVAMAALRQSSLDYRALLDTNYKHGDDKINLFEIAVEQLLHDYEYTVPGGTFKKIGELWSELESLRSGIGSNITNTRTDVTNACNIFNAALNEALARILTAVNQLLSEFGHTDLDVTSFAFSGLTPKPDRLKKDRGYNGCFVTPKITFRGHQPDKPQHFLNEARLSALGLSIYLAGRLVSVPNAPSPWLKLMVLDDVLIGLDHSNRLPVLEALKNHFSDWQIVLLTHDRGWFEMARLHLEHTGKWESIEIFEGDKKATAPFPIVRSLGSNATESYLNHARFLLNPPHNFVEAAANYARQAFESAAKEFCDFHSVPVSYQIDTRHIDTEMLLNAIESWLENKGHCEAFAPIIDRVKMFRKIVLNPYSHALAPNIPRAEVEGAISLIETLHSNLKLIPKIENPLQPVVTIVQTPVPTADQLHQALAHLRVAVSEALRKFCVRSRINMPYSTEPVHQWKLWTAAKNHQDLKSVPMKAKVDAMEVERAWLIGTPSADKVVAITKDDMQRLLQVVDPEGKGAVFWEYTP